MHAPQYIAMEQAAEGSRLKVTRYYATTYQLHICPRHRHSQGLVRKGTVRRAALLVCTRVRGLFGRGQLSRSYLVPETV